MDYGGSFFATGLRHDHHPCLSNDMVAGVVTQIEAGTKAGRNTYSLLDYGSPQLGAFADAHTRHQDGVLNADVPANLD
jgi:hypothetical protein